MSVAKLRLLTISLGLLAVVLLTGCPSTPSKPSPSAAEGSAISPAELAAIAALEKTGAKLTKDKEGHVTVVALGNEGKDADLDHLLPLTNLFKLVADKREVTDAGLQKLKGHPSLKAIDLTLSGITNKGLAYLIDVPNLEEVNLKRADVSAEGYKALAQIKTLKRVRAAQSNFDDACLAELKGCSQLEMLDLQDCNRVTEDGLQPIAGFKNLKFLRLWGPTISDKVLGYAAEATQLRSLSLEQTVITIEGLKQLKNCTNLQDISLFGAAKIDDAALAELAGFTKLTKLELRGTVVKKGFDTLAGMKDLKLLDLNETNCKDAGLEQLVGFSNLEELVLRQSLVSDKGMASVAQIKSLKSLNLDKCEIGDDGVAQLKALPNLEFIHLGNTRVTDASLEHLASIKSLKKLEITFVPTITEEGLKKLKEALPSLEILK